MPLKLEIKRKLSARSDRVKSVDIHPSEPWMLVSLYNGNVHVWNHETQQLVKSFEVCEPPVRTAKFVARKNWIVTGSDDFQIRAFNYNTLERAHAFEAHSDYIRSIAVHPSQPYLLSSSDDMLIKLWDWENKWQCKQTFEGHSHYVMQIVFNPKDSNTFASASLDKTIKVWQLGSSQPNFTLEGHEKGVNCVDYYHGGDKPYLISGADDRLVKLWDYQNKNCVQTLEGHTQNISCVAFHTELPLILTGSEDGTVKLWHSNTYRLDNTLNYGLERVWALCCLKGSNNVAIGYDEGSVMIKLGREEPAISMDSSGKIIWAKHSEIQQANLRALGGGGESGGVEGIRDGEKLPLTVKDMGACDIYPQTISHNPNGRFVVACGDGEYIIYTSMALRNKAYGPAQEFIWSFDSSEYAIRDGNQIKIFKNFKERKSFKPSFGTEAIYGGHLLGVKSVSGLSFFEWESTELVRRIEITPKLIFWSENGEQVAIACEESFYVLKYNAEAVANAKQNPAELVTEDGIEDAFTVLNEVNESVRTGLWIGDCFIYTNSLNRLNYYVGGEICTISHLDRQMYLLGYIPADNRVYLSDKDLNIVSFSLLLAVLEYQTAVMRKDFDTADRVLPTIPRDQCSRVAHFLEKQGFKQQALAVTNDPEHKFDLAVQLGDLRVAYQIAKETESEQKWKLLSEVASKKCQFNLAQDCLQRADDFGSLVLLASSNGNVELMSQVAESAKSKGQNNISFLSYFTLGRLDDCLQLLIETNRLPEAAFFARTYMPSQISRVVALWKDELKKTNEKAAQALADPAEYENLFGGYQDLLKTEQFLAPERQRVAPAKLYPQVIPNHTRKPIDEMLAAEENNEFFFDASKLPTTTDTTASTTTATTATTTTRRSVENEDEFADAVDSTTSPKHQHQQQEESIASLARKIQETKLSQAPSTISPPKTTPQAPPPAAPQRQVSSQPGDDDLDLDIDAELENVDTSDVNLNDDLSDD